MIAYVKMTEDNVGISEYSTFSNGYALTKVIQDDPMINFSKLQGYKVQRKDEDGMDHLMFDLMRWNEYENKIAKEKAVEEGTKVMNSLSNEYVLRSASDADAYKMRYLYESWKKDTDYEAGDRRLYGDNLYKCKQKHTSQAQYPPDLVPALWDIVGEDNRGTLTNPIIIPDNFSSMEYVKGKYYKEGDVLYLMNREGMNDGETVSLTYKPSALVGQYFTRVG